MVSGTIYYPPSSSFHYRADQCRQLERQQCYRRLGSKQGSNDNDRSVSLPPLPPSLRPVSKIPPVNVRRSLTLPPLPSTPPVPRTKSQRPPPPRIFPGEHFANNTMMMMNQVYLSKMREELPALAPHVAPL